DADPRARRRVPERDAHEGVDAARARRARSQVLRAGNRRSARGERARRDRGVEHGHEKRRSNPAMTSPTVQNAASCTRRITPITPTTAIAAAINNATD